MCGRKGLLKIDVDEGMAFPNNRRLDHLLARAGYRRESIIRRRSPSGSGWHLVLTVSPTPQSDLEVVALQAILGSDPLREACNLHRANLLQQVSPFWQERWNVLYK